MDTKVQDPDDVLDYKFPTSALLQNGETISNYTVTAETGLTVESGPMAPTQADGDVTCWLSGGTLDSVYEVTCHIETSAGREFDSSFKLWIQDQ